MFVAASIKILETRLIISTLVLDYSRLIVTWGDLTLLTVEEFLFLIVYVLNIVIKTLSTNRL